MVVLLTSEGYTIGDIISKDIMISQKRFSLAYITTLSSRLCYLIQVEVGILSHPKTNEICLHFRNFDKGVAYKN